MTQSQSLLKAIAETPRPAVTPSVRSTDLSDWGRADD
jgi:hypothetical protein